MRKMGRNNRIKSTKKDNRDNAKNATDIRRDDINLLCDKLLLISTTALPQNAPKAVEFYKKIDDTLSKIRDLEVNVRAVRADQRNNSDTLQNFLKWMDENGAKYEGVEIAEFAGYDLGLRTTRDVNEASLVITVPRRLMMTIDSAKKSGLRELLEKDKILQGMNNVALAMFLLLEKYTESSFWRPYIDVLPNEYTTVLYFTYDELMELKDTPTFEPALNLVCSIARQYAYFNKIIHTSEDAASKKLRECFTYDNYRWAVSTVMTRQNSIPSEDGSQLVNALIPLWDFCNHTNGNISTQYNPELNQSECLAVRDFSKGEQFFISYGKRSNDEFFIHNGFVYEENENDGYWLKLGVSKSDRLKEKRTALLHLIEVPTQGEYYIKKGPKPFEFQLIAFLRIFNMDEGNLEKWLKSDQPNKLKELKCKLECKLEIKVWEFLKTRLQLILAAHKNSHPNDLEMLKDPSVSSCMKLAIKMRNLQVAILSNAVDHIHPSHEVYDL